MNQIRSEKLTPVVFKTILLLLIAALVAIFLASFLFFQVQLKNLATDVKKANSEASASKGDLDRLKGLREYLDKERDAIERTKKIVADSQSYQYQDQIINDITAYALKSGVSITGLVFDTATTANPSAPQATPAPTSVGPKFMTATINIKSPAPYRNVMQFLYYLEQNLTKMQISGVTMSKESRVGQNVTVSPLSVKVYVK